jgi:hypothetical protein
MAEVSVKIRDRNFYNVASAKQLGWEPSWFGCYSFGNELLAAIEAYQIKNALTVDGLVGPATFKAITADREAAQFLATNELEKKAVGSQNMIICGGSRVPIKWDKFVGMSDPGNLAMSNGFIRVNSARAPKIFAIHWDCALSARSCRDILAKRHLGVHFCIDNDGSIYQLIDCNDSAQHVSSVNMQSIGVEISSAVELKYQKYYEAKGFGPRPIWAPTVHKQYLGKLLGFYPAQIQALEALLLAVCGHYRIPFETPLVEGASKPTQLMGVSKLAAAGKFSGVVAHYHLTVGKTDPAGLDFLGLMNRLKGVE